MHSSIDHCGILCLHSSPTTIAFLGLRHTIAPTAIVIACIDLSQEGVTHQWLLWPGFTLRAPVVIFLVGIFLVVPTLAVVLYLGLIFKVTNESVLQSLSGGIHSSSTLCQWRQHLIKVSKVYHLCLPKGQVPRSMS